MRSRIILALTLTAALGTTAAWSLTSGDEADPAAEAPADPASGACLENDPECSDIPGNEGEAVSGIAEDEPAPGMNMCLPDVPDCVDVVIEEPESAEPGE